MKLDDNYLYVINFSNQTISNYNVYYSVDISNNVEHRIFNILNKNSLFIENHSQLFLKLKPLIILQYLTAILPILNKKNKKK